MSKINNTKVKQILDNANVGYAAQDEAGTVVLSNFETGDMYLAYREDGFYKFHDEHHTIVDLTTIDAKVFKQAVRAVFE